MTTNTRITLTQRPDGMPQTSDFGLIEEEINDIPPGCVLVKADTLSVDAFIRTTLDAREDSHHGAADLGTPVVALGVGEVVQSSAEGFAVGDWVTGPLMAQTHAVLPEAMVQKISPAANIPPSTYLGILGMTTGLTAWAGMVKVGEVKADDTVVVSGAAGAVGTVASQLAKARGATVIGIAGGTEKGAYLTEELGLDHAIDYKAGDVRAELAKLAPSGVDLFFDNVGGEILDDVLDNLAMNGTIVICGAISQYQNMEEITGPKLYLRVAERNAKMCGSTVDHYMTDFPQGVEELTQLMTDGQIKLREQVVEGVERFPEALITLLSGGHTGKLLVKP